MGYLVSIFQWDSPLETTIRNLHDPGRHLLHYQRMVRETEAKETYGRDTASESQKALSQCPFLNNTERKEKDEDDEEEGGE
jgi:hypothetical protein